MLFPIAIERSAQVNPQGVATSFRGRKQTWTELRARVAALAAGITALGISEGDRVAILALNSDRYLETLYAIWWAGAVAVPMNTRWAEAEHIWSARDCGARLLFADDIFAQVSVRIASECGDTCQLVHIGEGPIPSSAVALEALIARNEPIQPVIRAPTALAGLYYTGGTTGRPKGVMLSELALWSSAMSMALDLGLKQSDVYLHAAPMFHLADGSISLAMTVVGATHSIVPAFEPKDVAAAISTDHVTKTLIVPTMVRMLIDSPDLKSLDAASLDTIVYGASPMPAPTLRDAMAALPGVHFVQAYGQSEMAPLCAIQHFDTHPGQRDPRPGAAGRASPGIQIKIAASDGTELPRGEVGEIWARGPNMMTAYWNAPEQTAACMNGGWVRTGDAAWMDQDGFVYISDRLKDMIISGGENIFSIEVEDTLRGHPSVRDVAVIGVPDEIYGERVHAVVVVRKGFEADLETLQLFCRSRIAGYKIPRSIELHEGPLPVSGAGKVLKVDLRAPHWAALGTSVN